MRLLPAGAVAPSLQEDGLWAARPGYPRFDGSWLHPPPPGAALPEFACEDGHELTRNEPSPVYYVGGGNDCHVRLPGEGWPRRLCRLYKEGRTWFVEGLLPGGRVRVGDQPLDSGERVPLADGQCLSLAAPPTPLAWRVCIRDEDNAYLDEQTEREFVNKYPSRFPCRSSLAAAPPAPEALRRLAWQTDQMRRRSEDDQVRVADWSAFSQYVKRHYYKNGITCTSWAETGRGTAVDVKPPSWPPQAYPPWIAALISAEKQLPGIAADRPLPFASSLALSGEAGLMDATSGADVAARAELRRWLEDVGVGGHLQRYLGALAGRFGSAGQIRDQYCEEGRLSPAFLDLLGVQKLGHRRLFERWFLDHPS